SINHGDIKFFWTCNNTLVNDNLTAFYRESSSDVYVDGVSIRATENGARVDLFLTLSRELTTRTTEIDNSTWDSLGKALLDQGVRQMHNTTPGMKSIWDYGTPRFYIEVYFSDGVYYVIGMVNEPRIVQITCGFWSGYFNDNGFPDTTGFASEVLWLLEEGHLQSFRELFYQTLTQNITIQE
ncbi:MAG: hypothetical protein ACTSX2_14000, partial [Candidatus Thorarchaeota archaeon]